MNYIDSTNVLTIDGFFTDSTLATRDGYFTYYDNLGLKLLEGNFHNNREDGLWLTWDGQRIKDTTLKISDSSYYNNGELVSQVSLRYHSNGKLFSRNFNDSRKKIKEIMTWDNNGNLQTNGLWVNGEGDDTRYYKNGKPKTITHFTKNNKSSSKEFAEDGHEKTKAELKAEQQKIEEEMNSMMANAKKNIPYFPGGAAGFKSYLERRTKFPNSFLQQMSPGEKITISFHLNQDGFAYDIRTLDFQNSELQEAIENAFKNMPAWDMKGFKKFGPLTYVLNVSRF